MDLIQSGMSIAFMKSTFDGRTDLLKLVFTVITVPGGNKSGIGSLSMTSLHNAKKS